MKTKEVIQELKKMGLQTKMQGNNLNVVDTEMWTVANINLKEKFRINTNFWAFKNELTEDEKEKIYFLLTKLAETDPEEREEKQKYLLKHKWFDDSLCAYINYCIPNDSFNLNSKSNNEEFKTQFTQAEIDEIKERFNTNLEDFERILVED